MGNRRTFSIVAVVVSTALHAGAVAAAPGTPEPSPPELKLSAFPEMEFYLARGETDACGRGCNEWIAAEGKIDLGAAQRLRRLLNKLGARRPPIYFHSPGGTVLGALALGRLIRDRKLQVSVANTVPLGCERDKPFEKSCEAQKRSGHELRSQFDPTTAMCNSACVYAVAGGAARIVPPGVKLGIHDIGLDPARAPLPAAVSARAKSLVHLQIQEYLREMGIDQSLYAAVLAVPNHSRRFLEREELVRFGIDRRQFGETPWEFLERPRRAMWKRFFVRAGDGQLQYLDGLVSLTCAFGPELHIALARGHAGSEATTARPFSVSIGGRRVELPYQATSHEFYTRSARLAADTFAAVGDDTTLEIVGIGPVRGEGAAASMALTMAGFSRAYAKLKDGCEQAAPPGQLNVGTSNYDPNKNPNCRPGGDPLKCLQGDTGLRSSAQSPPPNVFRSVPPANVVRTVPIKPGEKQVAVQSPPADSAPRPPLAILMNWKGAVISQLVRNRRYPPDANGEPGTVTIAFRLDRTGHVVESRIARSSGFAVLDAATLTLVRRSEPFPAPTAEIPDAELSFTVPLYYAAPLAQGGDGGKP